MSVFLLLLLAHFHHMIERVIHKQAEVADAFKQTGDDFVLRCRCCVTHVFPALFVHMHTDTCMQACTPMWVPITFPHTEKSDKRERTADEWRSDTMYHIVFTSAFPDRLVDKCYFNLAYLCIHVHKLYFLMFSPPLPPPPPTTKSPKQQ